jgi:hypothetical protein
MAAGSGPRVVNVGLSGFAPPITEAGGAVIDVQWTPPGAGDAEAARALAELTAHPDVEAANARAMTRYLEAEPGLVGVAPARDAIDGLGDRTLLHAGPPVAWDDMCGPMQGALAGAMVYEGWARTPDDADALVIAGDVAFAPCHHLGAVGPMAGVVSPSMPMWIVSDETGEGRAFCSLNEGLGKVLRFGANDASVIERLNWMAGVLGPTLAAAIERLGRIELKPLMAQALHMGDEVHNRNVAATGLLFKRLLPALLETGRPSGDIAAVAHFIAGNDHFFLNISMAACKLMLDAAHGIPNSSMVTAMARNGVEFGIRVSGAGARWFTAPAPVIDGLFFPGYGIDDANPDLGDSAITETAGIGGFAMAAAPAIVQFVGGSADDALAVTDEMAAITLGRNNALTLPALDFAGTPAGIDVRRVVDTNILPAINTGIAHRDAGIGQVGAGLTRAPMACFTEAVKALARDVEQ